jgi:acetyl-CoA C-acetyltransferase
MPVSTPATTVNKVCGSALKAVMMAANSIRAGEYSVIVAGGMESMSNAPYFAHKTSRTEFSEMKPTMVHDGLWDVYNDEHMGNTGEAIAEECDISRETADIFSARSHKLADAAWNQGWMDFEVVETPGIERDEGVCPGENLGEMQAAFIEGGKITAGNSSQLSDGAAAVLVASRDAADANGWPVLATVLDYCTSGVEPARVMVAPIPAIETLLNRNGLTIGDLAYVEHNEAFAAASCAIAKGCNIPDEKLNPHGGAVAIGHPLGATGARCLMTLINALRHSGGGKGIVTLCLGGGNAVAMLVEA